MTPAAHFWTPAGPSSVTALYRLITQRGYTNRSEAFRDLIRDELVERTWESPDSQVVGTITLVYNHHVRLLSEKLTGIQHDFHRSILSTLHVHLDHRERRPLLRQGAQGVLEAVPPRFERAWASQV